MSEFDPILDFVAGGGSIEIAGFGYVFPKSWYKRPQVDTPSSYARAPDHRHVPTGNLRRL